MSRDLKVYTPAQVAELERIGAEIRARFAAIGVLVPAPAPAPSPEAPVIGLQAAAALLSCSTRTVARLAAALPPLRRGRAPVWPSPAALREWAAEARLLQATPPPAPPPVRAGARGPRGPRARAALPKPGDEKPSLLQRARGR
jgi:hypothetical protein